MGGSGAAVRSLSAGVRGNSERSEVSREVWVVRGDQNQDCDGHPRDRSVRSWSGGFGLGVEWEAASSWPTNGVCRESEFGNRIYKTGLKVRVKRKLVKEEEEEIRLGRLLGFTWNLESRKLREELTEVTEYGIRDQRT